MASLKVDQYLGEFHVLLICEEFRIQEVRDRDCDGRPYTWYLRQEKLKDSYIIAEVKDIHIGYFSIKPTLEFTKYPPSIIIDFKGNNKDLNISKCSIGFRDKKDFRSAFKYFDDDYNFFGDAPTKVYNVSGQIDFEAKNIRMEFNKLVFYYDLFKLLKENPDLDLENKTQYLLT